MKFSKIYSRFKVVEPDIIKYIEKNGYNPSELALYSATSGVPVYVVHFVAYKFLDREDALDYTKEVCEFYRIEFDI